MPPKQKQTFLGRLTKTHKPQTHTSSSHKTRKLGRKQAGGLKLGQGSFGCVITPAVKCPSSLEKLTLATGQQQVSKIVYKNPKAAFKYDRELQILRKVAEADKKQHYLIGLVDECELDISAITGRKIKDTALVTFTNADRSEWKLSDGTQPATKNATTAPTILPGKTHELENLSKSEIKSNYCLVDPKLKPRNQIQVNGGMELNDILQNPRSRNYGVVRRYYLNIIRDILIGVQLMHKARIAHRDIKENNLVCQVIPIKRKGRPDDFYPVVRHIDFGLAEIGNPDKTYKLADVRYAGTSMYIPPDILLMSSRVTCMMDFVSKDSPPADLQNLTRHENKAEIVSDLLKRANEKEYYDLSGYGITHSYGTGIRDTEPLNDFMTKHDLSTLYDLLVRELMDGSFSHKYSADYDGYLYKTDIFAAGVTIAVIRTELGIRNPKLSDLIANMVRFDPNKRFNINQCLAHPVFKN
jgi:serine/threonine protein kinase